MSRKFIAHYFQMLAAMAAGMMILEPVRMMIAPTERVEFISLAMASEMSVGMVAWMRFRRHAWLPCFEMCLAMFVPFIVLLVPYWTGLIGAATVLVGGHLLMLPAMVMVMRRLPAEFGMLRDRGVATHQPGRMP